ncbi:MAG: hypothetical protein H7X71_05345 [Chitinophagales bacterium]|nr:hypothetical protein [Chitinophagales bacterium]
MKKIFKPVVFGFLIIPVIVSSQTDPDFKTTFKQLEGSWLMESEKGFILEEWNQMNDSTFAGASYFIPNNGKIKREHLTANTFYAAGKKIEEITISKTHDGIYYIPVVNGQNNNEAVYFKLISAETNNVHFQNREHDFPQNIIYEFTDADHITATLSGPHGDEVIIELFPYTRFP